LEREKEENSKFIGKTHVHIEELTYLRGVYIIFSSEGAYGEVRNKKKV